MKIQQFQLASLRALLLFPLLGTSLALLNGCVVEPERAHVVVAPPPVEVEPVIVVDPEHRR